MRRARPWLSCFLFLSSLLRLACSATPGTGDAFCVDACRKSFGTVKFIDSDLAAPPLAPECNGSLHLQSLYLCVGVHCSEGGRVDGLDSLNQTCREATGRPIPPYEAVANFTEEDIANLPRFNVTNPPRESPVKGVILPTGGLVAIWIRTLVGSYSPCFTGMCHSTTMWGTGRSSVRALLPLGLRMGHGPFLGRRRCRRRRESLREAPRSRQGASLLQGVTALEMDQVQHWHARIVWPAMCAGLRRLVHRSTFHPVSHHNPLCCS